MESIKDYVSRAYLSLSLALDRAVVNNLPTDRLESARNDVLDLLTNMD